MGNAKFGYFNYLIQDDTEITVSSGGEDPFYPVSNLKHPHAIKAFRSLTDETSVVVFDMQSAVSCNAFMSVGNSLNGLDLQSVTIEANATDVWTSPAFTTTVTDFDYIENFASKFFDTQTYRYWRITFVGATSYVEVGKAFLGMAVYLENNNLSNGFEFGQDDISDTQKGRYGQLFVDEITSVKTLKGLIGLMTPTELDTIRGVWDYCGTSKPFWFVPDPDQQILNNKDILSGYYYFSGSPKFRNDFFQLYSTQFEIEEAK